MLASGCANRAVGTRLDPDARETLRRIKYTVLNHRKGRVLEPLGD